jgi:uncharacterized protein (DUF1330 family)
MRHTSSPDDKGCEKEIGRASSRRIAAANVKGRIMAKGYWLALVDVADTDGYKAYAAAIQDVLRKFGGRYVIRAGRSETMDGKTRSRLVTIEFKDYETALGCYRSPEYGRVKKLRCHELLHPITLSYAPDDIDSGKVFRFHCAQGGPTEKANGT